MLFNQLRSARQHKGESPGYLKPVVVVHDDQGVVGDGLQLFVFHETAQSDVPSKQFRTLDYVGCIKYEGCGQVTVIIGLPCLSKTGLA